ncbi:DUF1800 domain-containing protein [Janthinobacterium fluminis]|uniref:DUF1800 domain-containing protein n=1 Tax=Janthinobacterium fluminis TaxID=2987524 RepID=A0ABT5K4X4_9BURK|nr:DUF1800 domain-containing protein [Janthinobacterium fluminis]MDC8760038.1 DUF1800 domain-containing protein [Janthinobacterium fluminis]
MSMIRFLCAVGFAALAGCAAAPPTPAAPASAETLALLARVSWGVNSASLRQLQAQGWDRYLDGQLHPPAARLPAAVQAQIDAMAISRRPLVELVRENEQRRKALADIATDEERKLAQNAYQQEMNRLAREAASRSLLRALYSPNQLQEQMTWFWMNHFSVHQGKHNLRAMVGDYEARAIAPHALGKFRALLGATARHPAMLRYLDNEANAAKGINENYARELMELHTLGVDGGYSQRDVQELARILTGVGVNLGGDTPKVAAALQAQYVRDGLFEFNPNRHDYGDKQFLGQTLRGRGLAELDEALDRLSRSPATARFISRKLAQFLVADEPPAALVERLAQVFLRSDGDIAVTLRALFADAEFRPSLGRKFKDPLHYVVSAVRLSYDDKPILNTAPMLGWLRRMGQPLYDRQTPDGYPLVESAWASPGQMNIRFDIARTIGSGAAGLFKTDGPAPQEVPAFPQLANALYYQSLQAQLSPATAQALEQAASAQEWNIFLLSSPEMMRR